MVAPTPVGASVIGKEGVMLTSTIYFWLVRTIISEPCAEKSIYLKALRATTPAYCSPAGDRQNLFDFILILIRILSRIT